MTRFRLSRTPVRAALLGVLLITQAGMAQTAGSVSFNVTIASVNGNWGTRHYTVAWVTKEDGTFIKTLWKQGKTGSSTWTSSEWTKNCPDWNTARGGANGSTAFDGYTSATAADYSTPVNNPIDPVWNCQDANNNLVADGNYKFWVQYGHSDAAGPVTTNGLLWTKRSTSYSNSSYSIPAPNTANFTNMSIVWTPAPKVAPSFTSSAPPVSGKIGTAYNHTCTASGSTPVTFTITAGSLPPPLTLSSAGVISGTPTTAGTFTGTITAANGTLPNATQNFSITIPQAIMFTSAPPPGTGNVGTACSHTCTATGDGTITFTKTSGTLPTGLTLTSSGVLSGTPSAIGTFTGTIQAANSMATPVTQNFSIVIGPALVYTAGRVNLTATLNDFAAVAGSDHFAVVWVTTGTGTFIKTLWKQGPDFADPEWTDHFNAWTTARGANTVLDGYSSPTATTYSPPNSPLDLVWNCRDASDSPVPDGDYKFWIQYTEHLDGEAPVTTSGLLWTKRPTSFSNTCTNQGITGSPVGGNNFTNMSIFWTPPVTLQSWATAAGLPPGQDSPGQTPQNDGVTNLAKFACNLDPTKPDVRMLTVGAGGTAGLPGGAIAAGTLRLEFLRRKEVTNPGITYTPQFCSSLGTWTDFTGPPTNVTSVDSTWERVVVDDPVVGETKRFGRVRVVQP